MRWRVALAVVACLATSPATWTDEKEGGSGGVEPVDSLLATDAEIRKLPGGLFGHRLDRTSLKARGGGPDTERAVQEALAWLAAHESPDGGWDATRFDTWCDRKPATGKRPDGIGKYFYSVGVTGIALCAFLGAGHRPGVEGKHSATVERGLEYLLRAQDERGCLGPTSLGHEVYNHIWAALAIVEAYALTGTLAYRESGQRAIDFIQSAQNPGAGWRYGVRAGDNDSSVTAGMLGVLATALEANRLSLAKRLVPPFRVEAQAAKDGRAWLRLVTDPKTGRVGYMKLGDGSSRPTDLLGRFPPELSEAVTAAALSARLALGDKLGSEPALPKAAGLVRARPPTWDIIDGGIDMYYWFHGTAAMARLGGAPWTTWNEALKKALLPNQITEGDPCGFLGSWDPNDPWAADGGRLYSTAMCAMCLEGYYRILR